MDQNLIRIYLKRSGELIIAFIIISFFLERALYLLSESRFSINRFNERNFKELKNSRIGFHIKYVTERKIKSMYIL